MYRLEEQQQQSCRNRPTQSTRYARTSPSNLIEKHQNDNICLRTKLRKYGMSIEWVRISLSPLTSRVECVYVSLGYVWSSTTRQQTKKNEKYRYRKNDKDKNLIMIKNPKKERRKQQGNAAMAGTDLTDWVLILS